jgi:hypothetical protein
VAYEKINPEGRLERVAFADRPLVMASQVQPQKPIAEISSPKVKTRDVPAAIRTQIVSGNTLQNRAQQLLAQRKSVKAPVECTIAQANTEGALARYIASIAPASGGEGRAMRAGSQKGAEF